MIKHKLEKTLNVDLSALEGESSVLNAEILFRLEDVRKIIYWVSPKLFTDITLWSLRPSPNA